MLLLPKVVKDQSSSFVKKVGKIVMTVLATATVASAATASVDVPLSQEHAVAAPMLLLPSNVDGQVMPWHSSHASHASHASHSSHMSHMSHFSGRY